MREYLARIVPREILSQIELDLGIFTLAGRLAGINMAIIIFLRELNVLDRVISRFDSGETSSSQRMRSHFEQSDSDGVCWSCRYGEINAKHTRPYCAKWTGAHCLRFLCLHTFIAGDYLFEII